MATYAENLITARDQTAERLVEVTASANPDYSVGNRSISKGAYLAQLTDQLDKLNALIAKAASNGGAWEVKTIGRV